MKLSTIGTELLKRMGFIGTGDPISSILPRANTPASNQELIDDFTDASRIANPDTWSKYATIMKRPASMDQVLDLWEEMGTWDMMAAALTELVEEATQRDPINPGTLWFECNDHELEDNLNEMLDLIGVEDILNSQVWYLAALGNHYEKIEYATGDGVQGLHFIHPKNVRRYWLEKNRQCIGFKWNERQPRKSDVFVAADGMTEIPRATMATSQGRSEELWYPWDILHMRRMFRMRTSEYGEAVYDEAQGIYKKLRMAVDQMVVHRAQVQPDRYVVNIDVQEQAPADQMRTVQRWKQQLRTKQSFGSGSSTDMTAPTEFKSFYNPWALDSVLWVAMPKGFQHAITKLAGTANVPDVYDIELLTDLFYSILGMPKSWFGIGEGGQNAPSGKSLLAQDIRFLRKVRSIRKPILAQYTWLGNFHAILKGKTNLDSLNIQAKMADIGGLEDHMKMELLSIQADILSKLADVMTAYNLPKEAWIELVFKRYLRLPDDVVNVFMTALPAPAEQQLPMESQRVSENIRQAFEAIQTKLGPERAQLQIKIRSTMEAAKVDNHIPKKYHRPLDVLSIPSIRTGDSIVVGDSREARMEATSDFKVDPSIFNAPKVTPAPIQESKKKIPGITATLKGSAAKPTAQDNGANPVFESTSEPGWRKYTRVT